MTAPQQVWSIRKESGRKRGECHSDEELLTMGGGGGGRGGGGGGGGGWGGTYAA